MTVTTKFAEALSWGLRHPWTTPIKMRLRNAIWRIRGLAVRNPPAPSNPRCIVFVCQGNICRSPFAAEVARRLLPDGIRCLSAGFRATANASSPAIVVEAAERRGVSLRGHQATLLTPAMMASADLVFVMEAWHVTLLRSRFGNHRHKILLLPLFDPARESSSSYDRFHIADPYGKSAEVLDACFSRLERTIAAVVQSCHICAA
jgi:protein-tyrosine phosphatase